MSLIFHYLKFNLCRLHTNQEKGKERKPTVSEKGWKKEAEEEF